MIAWLKGKVIDKLAGSIVLDVGGVGYDVLVSTHTLFAMPVPGTEITVYVHTVVREDAITLFGFKEKLERTLFRTLIKVNGIGPRTALGMLSGSTPSILIDAIHHKKIQPLVLLPGIGKKTAERVLLDLGDRIATILREEGECDNALLRDELTTSVGNETVQALVALGYKAYAAEAIVRKLDDGRLSSDQLIRESLRHLSKTVA